MSTDMLPGLGARRTQEVSQSLCFAQKTAFGAHLSSSGGCEVQVGGAGAVLND